MSPWIRKNTLLTLSITVLLAACNLPGNGVEPREAVSSPQPTAPSEDGGSDACLTSLPAWFMYTGSLDLLVGTLIPIPNVHVPDGTLAIAFDSDGTYDYGGNLNIHIDLGTDQYIEGRGDFD